MSTVKDMVHQGRLSAREGTVRALARALGVPEDTSRVSKSSSMRREKGTPDPATPCPAGPLRPGPTQEAPTPDRGTPLFLCTACSTLPLLYIMR
jgi:hypothetical protein